jgi:hypothetical protein
MQKDSTDRGHSVVVEFGANEAIDPQADGVSYGRAVTRLEQLREAGARARVIHCVGPEASTVIGYDSDAAVRVSLR